ncbi:MAG: phosphatase PAP2 family protein [Acidimicrobiia bacterium]
MSVAPPQLRGLHRRLPAGRVLRDGTVLYWWAELVSIVVFYVVYSTIRNLNGTNPTAARLNALKLMHWQETLGINHERVMQEWAVNFKPLIIACNYFYGSLHFVMTTGVMIFLYRKFSDDYPLWRNMLAFATALALIGFALWPLMPPRLLPSQFGFEDTLAQYPTFWSFNQGAVNKISNQFAAMPSVHCAWALWCALALVPRLRRRWAKVLAALYPVGTVISIVLTGNHFLLDAVGGFVVLGLGYLLARTFTRAGRGDPGDPPRTRDEGGSISAATT